MCFTFWSSLPIRIYWLYRRHANKSIVFRSGSLTIKYSSINTVKREKTETRHEKRTFFKFAPEIGFSETGPPIPTHTVPVPIRVIHRQSRSLIEWLNVEGAKYFTAQNCLGHGDETAVTLCRPTGPLVPLLIGCTKDTDLVHMISSLWLHFLCLCDQPHLRLTRAYLFSARPF